MELVDSMARLFEQAPTASLVAVLLLVALLVSRAAKRLINRLADHGHIPTAMARRLHRARQASVWGSTVLIALQVTGMFGQAWALASAIVAALALGFFAAWSILSNATCTLLILTLKPFRMGDLIELVEPTNATAIGGRVVDLNLMYTTLEERDTQGRCTGRVQIPNNLMLQKLVRVLHNETEQGAEDPKTPFLRNTRPSGLPSISPSHTSPSHTSPQK